MDANNTPFTLDITLQYLRTVNKVNKYVRITSFLLHFSPVFLQCSNVGFASVRHRQGTTKWPSFACDGYWAYSVGPLQGGPKGFWSQKIQVPGCLPRDCQCSFDPGPGPRGIERAAYGPQLSATG